MKRILLIEEDERVRNAFREALDGTTYDLTVASSATDAVAHVLGGEHVDLIFIKLVISDPPATRIPRCGNDIDTVKALERIRACCCRAPVFVMTAFDDRSMAELTRATQRGLTFDLVRQPLDDREILPLLDAVLYGRSMSTYGLAIGFGNA